MVISHDLSLLKYLADRVGVMYLGTLVELGGSDEVYSAPRHPYTAGLIESIPRPRPGLRAVEDRPGSRRRASVGGGPPSGCRFRTRCPLATERCAEEAPVLAAADGLHAVACHHPLTGPVPVPQPTGRTGQSS